MSVKLRAALFVTLSLACIAAHAEDARTRCIPLSGPRGAIMAHDGKWVELTTLQRAFLAGVFVLNPKTPAGLPYGEGAALAQVPGDKGGLVFWIDGEKACDPMAIPSEIVEMITHVGEGIVYHEGTPN